MKKMSKNILGLLVVSGMLFYGISLNAALPEPRDPTKFAPVEGDINLYYTSPTQGELDQKYQQTTIMDDVDAGGKLNESAHSKTLTFDKCVSEILNQNAFQPLLNAWSTGDKDALTSSKAMFQGWAADTRAQRDRIPENPEIRRKSYQTEKLAELILEKLLPTTLRTPKLWAAYLFLNEYIAYVEPTAVEFAVTTVLWYVGQSDYLQIISIPAACELVNLAKKHLKMFNDKRCPGFARGLETVRATCKKYIKACRDDATPPAYAAAIKNPFNPERFFNFTVENREHSRVLSQRGYELAVDVLTQLGDLPATLSFLQTEDGRYMDIGGMAQPKNALQVKTLKDVYDVSKIYTFREEDERDAIAGFCNPADVEHGFYETNLGEAPTGGLEAMRGFVADVKKELDEHHKVLVHCDSGQERTGTALAAFVIGSLHKTSQDAIDFVRFQRESSVGAGAQEAFLAVFAGEKEAKPTPKEEDAAARKVLKVAKRRMFAKDVQKSKAEIHKMAETKRKIEEHQLELKRLEERQQRLKETHSSELTRLKTEGDAEQKRIMEESQLELKRLLAEHRRLKAEGEGVEEAKRAVEEDKLKMKRLEAEMEKVKKEKERLIQNMVDQRELREGKTYSAEDRRHLEAEIRADLEQREGAAAIPSLPPTVVKEEEPRTEISAQPPADPFDQFFIAPATNPSAPNPVTTPPAKQEPKKDERPESEWNPFA